MKKMLKVVAIPFGILVIAIVLSFIFSDGIRYEVVQHGTMEKANSFEGVIIRDETVITGEKKGVLESLVSENEMVRKNKHVASIYESEIDDEAKNRLESINDRIEEIEKAKEDLSTSKSGVYQLEGVMDMKINEIRDASAKGDISAVSVSIDEINLLNDKRNALDKGSDYTDGALSELLSEKAEIEKSMGSSKQDVFASKAGIYTTDIDGFETILDPEAIGDMTPYDYDSLKKMQENGKATPPENAVCKIIEGTEWSVAFVATEKEISKLKEGSPVYIRAKNHADDCDARVSYISTPVNGNYLVVVTSDESCSWAMQERFVDIDLIRSRYSGLRVPIAALRVKDNETGVFTVVDGIVHFKKVNVLYKDTVYAIVEENNTSGGGLLLYDEVITGSRRELKDGERIS